MFKKNHVYLGVFIALLAIPISLGVTRVSLSQASNPLAFSLRADEWSATGGPWDPSGDACLFAIDAEVPQTVYVAIESSGISTVYKTSDDSATWTPRWTIDQRISALVARGGILYAGLNNAAADSAAIVRSEDNGVTWVTVMTATTTTTVNYFDLLPLPSGAIYAAATAGDQGVVLYSPDGITWETRYSITGQMVRVGVNRDDPTQVFGSGQNSVSDLAEVYRSLNSGGDWETVLSVAGEDIQDFLQVHPLEPNRMFVTTRPPGCCPPDPAKLWRSDNGGDTWNIISIGYLFNLYFAAPDSVYSIYDAVSVTHDASSANPVWINRGVPFAEWLHGRAVDVRPANPIIYAGLMTSGVFTSTDDGQSFQDANQGIQSLLAARSLVTDPQAAATLYAATDKGVFRTVDNGDHWNSIFQRVLTRDVAIHPQDSDILLVTLEDGSVQYPIPSPLVYRSEDGGLNWTMVYSATEEPGRRYGSYGLAFDPSDPAFAFATTCASTPGAESNNHLLRSSDGGLTWEDIRFTHGQVPGVVLIEVAADGTVYFGGKEGFQGDGRAILYRSTNHGNTWSEIYVHDSGWRVNALAIDPLNSRNLTMIVSENYGVTHLMQSVDAGDTWEELLPGASLRGFEAMEDLQALTYDPLMAGRLYLGADGPLVLVSSDHGQTWAEVPGWSGPYLAPGISALAVTHDSQDRHLYAGLNGSGSTGVWWHAVPGYQAFLPALFK